jgi:hypothetical protein
VGLLKRPQLSADNEDMRKQAAVVFLFVLVFASLGSSALAKQSSARSAQSATIRNEKRLGPRPLPRWYWRWVDWRLAEGYAKGRGRQAQFRPSRAPQQIPRWAWQRLHLFRLARVLARGGNGPARNGGETYRKAISYTRNRPSFTPTRTVRVSSAAELRAAISNLQPGDLVKATTSFTVSNSSSAALIIKNRLSASAEIDLTGVKIIYTGTRQENGVWLNNASNLYIFGGDISTSNTGGVCLRDYGSQNVLWWGFNAHNCGATGFQAQAIGGPVDHDDFQGTISKVGQNLAWDPHAEKGTGLHAANLWDANQTGAFINNRFAFYAHDIPVGACVEFGNNQPSSQATGNVLYLKCVNASDVAQMQTGGNALQIWGDTKRLGLDVKYLEGKDLQGFCLRTNGISSGQTAKGVIIEYGRATNTNQNPRYAGQGPWDSYGHAIYKRVRPAP